MTCMIISAPPPYCSGCGKSLQQTWRDKYALADFHNHASHTCQGCGTHFQYVAASEIIKLARDVGGDMTE